jgi:hypothetical protein
MVHGSRLGKAGRLGSWEAIKLEDRIRKTVDSWKVKNQTLDRINRIDWIVFAFPEERF